MYGSLDAAQQWGEHYARVLETGGFSRGVASPCHFFHKDLDTYILVTPEPHVAFCPIFVHPF